MPVTSRIDRDARIIRTRCVGDVTFAEVADHFRELAGDPAGVEDLDVVLDLSELLSTPTPWQLRAIVGKIERLQPKIPFRACAVVAATDVLFGLSRMFEAFAEERFRAIRVFRTVAEAEGWLASTPR